MKARMKKLIALFAVVGLMASSMCVSASNAQAPAEGAAKTEQDADVTTQAYDLYFVADPTLVYEADADITNQFVYAPVKYTIPAGTPTSTSIGDVLKDHISFEGAPSYVEGLNWDAAENYELTDAAKKELFQIAGNYTEEEKEALYKKVTDAATSSEMVATVKDAVLGERDFTGYSGWMMYLDGQTMGTDKSQNDETVYYSTGTTLAQLEGCGALSAENTDVVVQMYFSFNMGADIGMGGQSLPTDIIANPSYPQYSQWPYTYNWSGASDTFVSITGIPHYDSSGLVIALAEHEDSLNYEDSLTVLKDLKSDKDRIESAIADLQE